MKTLTKDDFDGFRTQYGNRIKGRLEGSIFGIPKLPMNRGDIFLLDCSDLPTPLLETGWGVVDISPSGVVQLDSGFIVSGYK